MVDHILFLSPVDLLLSLTLFSRFLSPQPFMKNDKSEQNGVRENNSSSFLYFFLFFRRKYPWASMFSIFSFCLFYFS
jgi:hypothetical protein